MQAVNVKNVGIAALAFLVGCVIGGLFVQWRMHGTDAASAESRATAAPGRLADAPAQPTAAAAAIPSRSVIINGRRLGDQDIEKLSQTFHMEVRDGDYWYDRINGSWGRRGGPTEGFTMAGLDIGGPLREDASQGDTGVFFNGRQLHRIDVARLLQLGPVYPGRYWMDAMGNIGFEGGPALVNIWAAAQAQTQAGQGRKEGILSTYDKTGVAVFGY
jgi:hypothetical protein